MFTNPLLHSLPGFGRISPSPRLARFASSGGVHSRGDSLSCALSFALALSISAGFFLSSPNFYHWFIIPVTLCGGLAGVDAIDWFRGRVHAYEIRGILGIYALHFFFLAPLLHVYWDFWTIGGPLAVPDWREWLGRMALWNALGLFGYRLVLAFFSSPTAYRPARTLWLPSPRFFPLCVAALVVTGATNVLVFARFGGISGYVNAFQEGTNALNGMGWILMISESFPLVLGLTAIVYFTRRPRPPSWGLLAALLLAMFPVQIIAGGLRGSRSNTVLFLFWMVGVIHYLIRPVPRKMVYVGLLFMIAFMYVYGFYKSRQDIHLAFGSSQERESAVEKSGRSPGVILLGDLARADVDAFLLYRYTNDSRDIPYAYGRTYLYGLIIMIPRALFPNRPDPKQKEGVDLEVGPGAYDPDLLTASRVYGLAGEAMINFSALAVPVVYSLFGLLVSRLEIWIAALRPGDLRFFLAPYAIYLAFTILGGDADNDIYFAVAFGAIPIAILFLGSFKTRMPVRFRPAPLTHASYRTSDRRG